MGGAVSQGLTPTQLAAQLGANQSSRGPRSLDPAFLQRISGKGNQPGIADQNDLSMAALMGLGGQK